MLLSSWLAPLRKGFLRTLVRNPRPKRGIRFQRTSGRMALEALEERALLAGPDIVGIAPNVGIVAGGSPFLANGQLLNEAPQNLTYTFSPSPVGNIDAATLSGIQLRSAGPDGSLGTADDATVVPGYIDSGSNINNIALYEGVAANQVVQRFSNTLEAGWYRITLDGAVLKGTDGTSFQHTDSSGATSSTYTLDFQIDPGPQVSSVVPQPVLRDKLFAVNGPIANFSDGDTVTISAGGSPLVFEFDNNGSLSNTSHIAVPYTSTDTPHSVAVTFASVLNSTTVPGFGGQTPAFRLNIAAPTAPPATGAGVIPRSFTLRGNAYTPVISISTVRSGVLAITDGALQQRSDLVQVYFNSNSAYNLLNPTSASNPAFYQLIDTADGSILLPQTVTYNQATNSALLQFSTALSANATFHLRVGVSQANQTLATALSVGTLFNSVTGTSGAFPLSPVANSGDYVTTGFIGTSIPAASSGTPDLNDDFHLYKFNVAADNTDLRVITSPAGANQTYLRLFSANGTEIFNHLGNDTNADSTAWNVDTGTYYLGVSSQGNSNYNPVDGRVVGGNGTWSGTFGLTLRVSNAVTTPLNTSSFGTSANLGSIGIAGQTINSQINPISVVQPTATLPPLPGSVDEPGHRDIPLGPADPLGQNETGGTRVGTDLYTPGQIPTFFYNFQLNYGYINGVAQVNQITATQRQRAREVFEIYGNYLGIKFVETANQGLTVATGDIHVVAPASDATLIGGIFGSPYSATGVPDLTKTDAIMNASIDYGTSEYGGSWFDTAFHEIGHALGLGHSFDVPSVMAGGGSAPGDAGSGIEAVYPGDYNLVTAQSLNGLGAPNGNDINLYQFNVDQAGTFSAETIAQRLASTSLLDSVLTLYGSTYRQATAVTDFATGGAVNVTFTAGPNQPGALGNQVVLNFQKAALGVTGGVRNAPTVTVVGSTITIRLNTSGGGTTALELVNAINNSQLASVLVSASAAGTSSTSLSGTTLTTLPLTGGTTTPSRQVIARNDDYYGRDSFLNLHLTPGVYYLGVSSTGNTNYDPTVPNSGFGGRTDGVYTLKMSFTADLLPGDTMVDSVTNPGTGNPVEIDGDHDGQPGGAFDFWFQTAAATTSAATNNTIYVDKNNSGSGTTQDGTIANPYNTIFAALAQAAARVSASPAGTNVIVRIAGNGGADGDPATLTDDRAYLLGFDSSNQTAQDGSTFQVPQGVTVMIDAGAVFKTRSAIFNVGSSQGNTFSGGALQVLGTPFSKVSFTSLANDSVGGHSDPPVFSGPRAGDWGGLVFRQDSDAQFLDSTGKPIFLNSVNQSNITYGGGQVSDGSVLQVFDPVHMVTSRPTIWFNTITNSADSAISADPNSFDNSLGRIGPDVHGNIITGNTINGFFIRTSTLLGQPPITLQVPARLAATDITYVLGDNLLIAGAPGGPLGPQARVAGSLVIDPGVIIKMASSRIETQIGGSQVIAEGTAAQPVVFTSLSDDTYGSGGTLDTSSNGATNGTPGDWGGFFFNAVTKGSLDHVVVAYGGGTTPIEGGFARFSAVQAQQAQLRLANSNLFSNSDGADTGSRNGRLSSADSAGIGATVFIRGGQPVLVNNLLENNLGHAISLNANSLNSQYVSDWGRSTASPDSNTVFAFNQFVSNQGPLVRLNVLVNNATNGMEVRGEIITTQTVWDDTDIVHVVRDQIQDVENLHTYGGIRLQSSADAGLVVKLEGATAGFTANGVPLDITDRVGGTIQIVGTPGHSVVLTSLKDDTVGAGLLPNGLPQNDTNNDGVQTVVTTTVPFADVIIVMDESVTMGGAQQFSIGMVQGLDTSLAAAGVGDGTVGFNQFGLVGFAGSGTHLMGHAHPLGAGGALFGTPAEYAVAAGGLVTNGGTEEGYSGIQYALSNYPFRPNASKIIILATDEDRDVVDTTLSSGGLLAQMQAAGVTLHTIVNVTLQDGAGASAVAEASDGTAFLPDGSGGFTTSPGGTLTGTPLGGTSIVDYVNLGFATGGITGDINQISAGGLITQSFSRALITTITTQITSGGSTGTAGDWGSILLDEYSNDTNVAVAVESEPITADVNATPSTAQFLGNLAPDHISGNNDQRLGFEIHGSIQNPSDVDVYSFKANSGTEAWFDLGRTSFSLDTIVDVLDANGNILAGLQNSGGAKIPRGTNTLPYNKDTTLAGNSLPFGPGQYYSSNPNDFAFRVILPTLGTTPGASNTYFVRVRSNAALTQGNYQLQIRTRQTYENPGSTISYSNIRYATNGIEVRGMPGHSPLVGTASTTQVVENGTAQGSTAANNIVLRAGAPAINGVFNGDQINIISGTGAGQSRTITAYNGTTATATVNSAWATRPDNTSVYAINGVLTTSFANPLNMGNLLESDGSNLSAAGNLTASDQVDWYQFDLNYNLIEAIAGTNGGAKSFPTILHVGYADGLSRANTTISVFDSTGTLIFVGRDSDIADENTSFGTHDPYIGSAELPTGVPGGGTNPTTRYYVAISSSDQLPTALDATFNDAGFRASQVGFPGTGSTNPLVRLEPITNVRRIVEDHIGFTGFTSGDTTITNGTLDVLPSTPAILPIDTVAQLQTVVTPFKLSDVVMFVYDQGDLFASNPQRGSNGSLGGFTFGISPQGGSGMPVSNGDITMRSDGRMFAYGFDNTASLTSNAGLFGELDTATGVTRAAPTGDLLADMTLPSTGVGALAYSPRFAIPDSRGDFYQLFFAIDDPSTGNSILYRANPNNGDTTPPTAVGQPPWGPRNSSGNGMSGVGGFTRGMAYLNNTLYGVSAGNQLFSINTGTGAATFIASIPTVGGGTLSGLTLAPQNAYNDAGTTAGFYQDFLFAIDSNGVVYCLDPALGGGSVLKTAFDTDIDGVSDSTSVSTGLFGASGLAFSPLDFNLWHPTLNRSSDQGHGINVAPDNSRIDPDNATQGGTGGITYPSQGSSLLIGQDQGGASFAFNLEASRNFFNFDDYVRYGGAQYGVNPAIHSELTTNTTTIFGAPAGGGPNALSAPTYNLPGGAYGSLITQSFDLSTYSAGDKPTLYFSYFLDTDGGSGNDGFAGNLMTDSARVFATNDNGVTWIELASNNPQLSPFSPTATVHAELPAFISDSKDADVTDTRQAIQPLFNSSATNPNWRQARIDLAQFAGAGNGSVKLRFDFSTAGSMNWRNQSTAVNPNRTPLPGDATGDFFHSFVGSTRRFQNNSHQGFYVDDIIVGLAERGEMVTNAPTGLTTFTQVPQNPNPQAPAPTLTGPYQLEIRRGTGGFAQPISESVAGIIIPSPYDSNARLNNQTIITDDFSSGTFSALPWTSTSTGSGGAWNVTTAAPFPRYSAQAGAISANETSTLSLTLDTLSGPGQVVGFDVSLSSTTADTAHAQLQFLIDGVPRIFPLSSFSAARGGGTTTLRGNIPFTHVQFTVPASAGLHTFQWVYSKDASASSSPQDTAYIAHVSVPSLTSALGSRALGDVGDRTPERQQGHVLISNNSISFSSQSGILVTAGARDQFGGAHPGPVQNLSVLNASRLIPGVEIVSNVIDNFGTSGITVAGDANASGALAPVPYARVLNNTVYGGNTPTGTGIVVRDNSSPTLLNNIIANTVLGVNVDLTSISTVLGWMFFKGNTNNARIGTTNFAPAVAPGSNGIAETNAAAPLFVSPLTGNFYLAGRTGGLSNQAVDSALDTLADRPAITVVQASLGIPQSPIISPNTDRFGQLRVNDPSQPPSGGAGSSIFKDRGAIERADFTSPTARLFVPLDNQTNVDFDPAADVVALSNPALLTTLTLQLDDVGIGLEDALIQTGQFRLDRTFLNTGTGAATTQTLVDGTDYVFSYNANTHRVSFTSSSVFATNSAYTITILGANTIPTGVPRVSDLAGNLLLGNVANGDDVFRIVVSDGVNHAPVNNLNGTALTAGATLTATEDQGFVLNQANGRALSVSDQDAFLGTNQVITTLTVGHGTWSFGSTVPAALNVVISPDGRMMTLTGTIPDINTAFRTGNLTYTPDADYFGVTGLTGFPPDSITMTTNDQANFAVPAQPAAQTTNVITLNVAQVNDAPLLTLTTTSPLVLTEIASGTQENRTMRFSYDAGALETNQHITGITFTATTTHVRGSTVNLPDPIAVDASNNPLVFPTASFSGTGFIRVTLPAKLAGTVVVAATITDDGTGGAANTRTIPNFLTIDVNPVNDPPTNNSTLTSPLRGTEEGASYTVVYSELLANSGAADEEGDPLYFRITSVNSGTLTLNGTAITNPVPANTFYRSTDTLIWTPAPGDAGLGAAAPDAFTVQAFTDITAAGDPEGAGGGGSGIDLHVTINVGHLPTLTTIDTIPGGHKNNPITISYATLLAASDAADDDNAGNPPRDTTTNFPLSFRVIAVSSGTLSVPAGTLIQPGQTVTWTPPANTVGTVPAFTVRAFDGVGLSAPPAVQVSVSVVNDLPTLSDATLTDPSYREDLPSSIPFATLAAAVGLADANSDTLVLRIESVAAGSTLTKGGVAVTPGVTTIGAGETIVWTGPANAFGTLPAFSVRAFDGTAFSPNTAQISINTVFVNDPPTLTTINPFSSTTVGAPFTISYAALVAASNLADVDAATAPPAGQTLRFRIQTVSNLGTLTKGGVAVSPGVTLLGPGESVVWTPGVQASGTKTAFTVVASDGTDVSSPNVPVRIVVANTAPVLTTISTLNGATEDVAYSIPYSLLRSSSNASDLNGDTISFRITAVAAGATLLKNGAAAAAGTIVSSGDTLSWRGAANAFGLLNAFSVRAFDGQTTSATDVQVRINVAFVNDRPTLTAISTFNGGTSNLPYTISYEDLLAKSDLADVDAISANQTLSFLVQSVTEGTLTLNGVAVVPGNTLITPGDAVVYTPSGAASGVENAFTVTGFDATSLTAPGALSSVTPITVKVDVSTMQLTRLFRAYNPNANYHFFTTSLIEFNNAVVHGYHDETTGKPGFNINPVQYPGEDPLFRLRNPNTGLHYYTPSQGERDILVGIGWTFEKIEGYIFQTQVQGSTQIYKLYNTQTGTHLYTESQAQNDAILTQFPGIWVTNTPLGFAYAVPASASRAPNYGSNVPLQQPTSTQPVRSSVFAEPQLSQDNAADAAVGDAVTRMGATSGTVAATTAQPGVITDGTGEGDTVAGSTLATGELATEDQEDLDAFWSTMSQSLSGAEDSAFESVL